MAWAETEHNLREMPVRDECVDRGAMQREDNTDNTGIAMGTWFGVLGYVYELLVQHRPQKHGGVAGDGRGNDDDDGDGGVRRGACHDYDDAAAVVDGGEIFAPYASLIWANQRAS